MTDLSFATPADLRAHYAKIRQKFAPARHIPMRHVEPKTVMPPRPPATCSADRDWIILERGARKGFTHLTVADIAEAAARVFGLEVSDIYSDRRAQRVARARQIVCWLARAHTYMSLPQIGRRLRRDHTTVLHAVQTIDRRIQTDEELRRCIALIEKAIGVYEDTSEAA